MAEEHLAAMDLEREHPWPKRELAAPGPLRLRPRSESGGAALVRFLVRRREEAWQRRVLRERENAAIDEEGLGLVEGLELAVRRQPAVVKPLLSELSHGVNRQSLPQTDVRLRGSVIPPGGLSARRSGGGVHEAVHSRGHGRRASDQRSARVAIGRVRRRPERERGWGRRRPAWNDLAARIQRIAIGRTVLVRDGGTLRRFPVRAMGQRSADACRGTCGRRFTQLLRW